MKKKVTELIVCLLSVICFLTACHTPQSEKLADGTYQADVTLTGGSGRATVDSPAAITVKDGKIYATIVWSSPYYDYMMVEDETCYNEAEAGENSTFTIPIEKLPCEISVIADTTAMSVPHEIEYTLSFALKETDFSELTKTGQWDLSYATQYRVEQYGEYDLITMADDSRFLLVPENVPVPEHVPEDVVVLKQPLDHTYLVSSSVMDMIREIGALSDIRLTGVKESDWYIEKAAAAMEDGRMLYAGKYNEPDYELILKEGCNFALENTMIGHNPEVKEKLESLGIPVMVERSSYEEHPLGRLEWIRLYGLLYGKEQEADAFYEEQLKKIDAVLSQNIKRVGVFVNETAEYIMQYAPLLDVIQLHGDENENLIRELKSETDCEIWKAIRVKTTKEIENACKLSADKLLIDSYSKDTYGGSGKVANWDLVNKVNINKPFFLAGGISSLNCKDAIKIVNPYGLDISSSVEINKLKDREKN